MNNKWALRTQLNEIGWLAVLFAVVGATVALRYMTGLLGTQWWQYLYVFGAAAGVLSSDTVIDPQNDIKTDPPA